MEFGTTFSVLFCIILCELCCLSCSSSSSDNHDNGGFYTNTYAVHIKGGRAEAERVAKAHNFVYVGEIIEDHHHFLDEHHTVKRSASHSHVRHQHLSGEPKVLWFEQQKARSRQKRDLLDLGTKPYNPHLNDPQWPIWYLSRGPGLDMNILPAWQAGYTGKGVVVSILDDGIERDHPDLVRNYRGGASYDLNDQDSDPVPRYDKKSINRHGTRCAGEVAAQANNSICSVGAAYNAGIGGVRMLDGDVTDAVEAQSLSLNPQIIDIYSASWGPDDDGQTVDGPGKLAKIAFRNGTEKGRNGLGSIFVWASGNGGRSDDSCGCDGYTNSIFTISVSSASERGNVPWYSESCASTLATTYSSGSGNEKQVMTTDLRKKCTDSHSGTSASAPLAAGICALALEANPQLNWRDLQHIIVMTARPDNIHTTDWSENGVGRMVSHDYGYGLMDAGAMVMLAKNWTEVPDQRLCTVSSMNGNGQRITGRSALVVHAQTTGCQETPDTHVRFLEHVVSRITLDFPTRGDLTIALISPAGTRSTLLPRRPHDRNRKGFKGWEFMTTHSWGENPQGEWTLEIKNHGVNDQSGILHDWTLLLYGTQPHPVETHEGPTHCEEGQYMVSNTTSDVVVHECQACHNACLTCYGADNGQCVHCPEYLEKDGGFCLTPSASSSPMFKTSSWLVLGGCITVLCLAFFLLFCIIFGSLQAADHGYCACSGKDWISSSDSDDYNYRQLMKLEENEDEEETLLSVQKNGKLPPL
ncbi:furin-like isoform X2 [Lytechinus variegatus]|uniref:furin-like isoform X2 n=1 Tax=Lytechinus variegatus TaxID=7654 RepID=UPI001BB20CC5|nr:furin-like isoform X2 [Lytechinus variegatus]